MKEFAKRKLFYDESKNNKVSWNGQKVCGFLTGFVIYSIVYPFDLLRVRRSFYQAARNGKKKISMEKQLISPKAYHLVFGYRNYYKGVLYASFVTGGLIGTKMFMWQFLNNYEKPYSTFDPRIILYGMITGFFQAFWHPFDVLRRSMQVHGMKGFVLLRTETDARSFRPGAYETAKRLYAARGINGFTYGWRLAFLKYMVNCSL